MNIRWRWCQQCAHLWNFPDQNQPPVLAFFPPNNVSRARKWSRRRLSPDTGKDVATVCCFWSIFREWCRKATSDELLLGKSMNHAKDTLRNMESTKVQIPNDSLRKNKNKLILILTISTCPSTFTRGFPLPRLRKTIIQIKFLAISSSLILLRNKIHPSRHSLRVYRNGSAQV